MPQPANDNNDGKKTPQDALNPRSPDWDIGQSGGVYGDEDPPKPVKAWNNPNMPLVAAAGLALVAAGVILLASRNGAAASGAFAMVKAAGRAL